MKTVIALMCIFSLLINSSCKNVIEKEGYVNVEGGKIWYKIVGEGDGIPLLILHGGPGSRSCSMIPGFSLLAKDRPVIFYDQLGSGNSDRPTDTTLWKTERFVNEIDLLRSALELDNLHILGHSCGSTFLIEYMITKQPKGVKSVIFSSPHISSPDWMADAKILLSQLPVNVQDTIFKYEALKNYNAPQYLVATDSFYVRHMSRKSWPIIPNIECENVPGFNDQIYEYMWAQRSLILLAPLRILIEQLTYIKSPNQYFLWQVNMMKQDQKLCTNIKNYLGMQVLKLLMMQHIRQWSINQKKVYEVISKFLNEVEKIK
ncbi:MAG: proline iminopeptidase-family hydrolase [Saprospiraceae bacterium]|nr:proline iminopeptidase-family hydrolase [Saprospiraceae bacterium]